MRLLPIALGLPGTIGFPTAIAHHRSPHRQVTEVSYAGKNIIAYHPSHGNAAPTSRMDCFVDSLLGGGGAISMPRTLKLLIGRALRSHGYALRGNRRRR